VTEISKIQFPATQLVKVTENH